MYVIKLDAIDSTNSYLKKLTSATLPKDNTVVVAEIQSEGRGQMGTIWQSNKGENLTASVFKRIFHLKIERQFYISMLMSLAIYKALKSFNIPKLSIKWPNDILSEDKKICGILIENVIKNNQLRGSIIGFGLNVNQKYFENLPQASSMALLTGIVLNKEEVLSQIMKQLQVYFSLLQGEKYFEIKSEYEALLFRKDKPSTFKTTDESTFSGIIQGVNDNGHLNVWTEDEIIKTYNFKEITLLY